MMGEWSTEESLMAEDSSISNLKLSSQKVGRLYPVLLDREGNIIDGEHRLAADQDWPKIRLDYVGSERERLLARLISNVCRRTVAPEEKAEMLERLGRIYLAQGEKLGRLATRIASETGMSYRWVMKYLPNKMKAKPGIGGPKQVVLPAKSEVAHRATMDFATLVSRIPEKAVVIKTYTNASFVSLTLEKRIYENYARIAEQMGVTPETLIGNVMILMLNEIKKTIPMYASCNVIEKTVS